MSGFQKIVLTPFLLLGLAGPATAALDANGVGLGASEREVKKAYPAAYCKPLEWKSDAADRRCDDAKVSFGGVPGRITFYLRKDAVQAFDLRFETRDLERLVAVLKSRYGKPASETRDTLAARDGRELYKALWEAGKDRATLVSQAGKNRGQLTVSRGSFEEEIYRVR
jgi:hypothetical protein